MIDLSKYLIVPFVPHGRDMNGCDCWGLVRLILKEEINISLPSFNSAYEELNTTAAMEAIENNKSDFTQNKVELENIEPYDVLLFYKYSKLSHVGLSLGDNFFIHTDIGKGVCIEKLERNNLDRLEGIYRVS